MEFEIRPITDRGEWLEWRRAFLTASDVGGIAGVDPYRTPLRIFAEKAGMVPDTVENSIMRRGRLLEGAALAYLAEEHPAWRIERPAVFIVDHENGLAGTPDALAVIDDERVNVQVKIVNRRSFEDWDGKPPLSYRLQTTAENYLMQADRGMLAVLVMSAYDAELVTFEVPRHIAAEERIKKLAREFRDNLSNGHRPPPDYGKDAEVVRAIFDPIPTEPPLDLSGDNLLATLLDARRRLKSAVKEAEEKLAAIDTELVAKLNGADTAVMDGWRITWREEMRKAYTVPAGTRRVLRVRAPKEDE